MQISSTYSFFSVRWSIQRESRGGRCKGDPRYPEGKRESFYAYGLEISSNNQAEAYALLQGFCLAMDAQVQSLTVVGDSSIIIQLMNKKSLLANYKLTYILV